MKPEPPAALLARARQWDDLQRWERKRLGQDVRELGLTYGEIRTIIPVPKSTLATWFRDIELAERQAQAISQRTGSMSQAGIPRDTQWRRRHEIAAIREEADRTALERMSNPLFVAGVCLYWAEGSKTRGDFSITNSDPIVLRTFVQFVRCHLDADATFALALNLHSAEEDHEARRYWAAELHLEESRFTKSYIKKPGIGHRRKRLAFGVCRVRVDRSSDHWHTTMQWIERVGSELAS